MKGIIGVAMQLLFFIVFVFAAIFIGKTLVAPLPEDNPVTGTIKKVVQSA